MVVNSVKNKLSKVILIIFQAVLGIILLIPFFVMLSRSLMTIDEVVDVPTVFVPATPQLINYYNALKGELLRPLLNTIFIVSIETISIPLAAYIAAYAFTKIKPLGSNLLFSIGMATIMLPGIVCTIPLYVQYVKWGWLNTYFPLLIPPLLGGGMMNIFLIMQFLKGVPNTYRDAARVDGANEVRISFQIILPLVVPVLTYIAVMSFIGAWNNFTGPLTYINKFELYTLPVAMYKRYSGKTSLREARYNEQCAMCVIMMIPPLVLFGFFQKQLIGGIALGGIKG